MRSLGWFWLQLGKDARHPITHKPVGISLVLQPKRDLKEDQATLSGCCRIFPPTKCSSLKKLFLSNRGVGMKLPPGEWSASDWSQQTDSCDLQCKVGLDIKHAVKGCSLCCRVCTKGGRGIASSHLLLFIFKKGITASSLEMVHLRGQNTSS